MRVLAVLCSGGPTAKEEPRLLGTVENEVSCRPKIAKNDALRLFLAWTPQMFGETRQGRFKQTMFQKHTLDVRALEIARRFAIFQPKVGQRS